MQSGQDDRSNIVEWAYDVKAETTGGSSTMQNAGACDALKISLDVVQGGAAVLGAGGGEEVPRREKAPPSLPCTISGASLCQLRGGGDEDGDREDQDTSGGSRYLGDG
jgi:hypothetical protein